MQLKEQFKGSVSVCIEISPAAQLQRASMSCRKDIAHKTSGSSKSRGTQIYQTVVKCSFLLDLVQ